tara:strand:- start:1404 stop:1721 length:318 start_codon:yes stop_codon:yes gene_type:complete
MADDCPTCRAVEALLVGSRRIPKPVARKIARSKVTKSADKALRRPLRSAEQVRNVRRASSYSKKLSKHLKAERKKAMKKNGEFKKGKSMKTVMAAAHKCVKREMR